MRMMLAAAIGAALGVGWLSPAGAVSLEGRRFPIVTNDGGGVTNVRDAQIHANGADGFSALIPAKKGQNGATRLHLWLFGPNGDRLAPRELLSATTDPAFLFPIGWVRLADKSIAAYGAPDSSFGPIVGQDVTGAAVSGEPYEIEARGSLSFSAIRLVQLSNNRAVLLNRGVGRFIEADGSISSSRTVYEQYTVDQNSNFYIHHISTISPYYDGFIITFFKVNPFFGTGTVVSQQFSASGEPVGQEKLLRLNLSGLPSDSSAGTLTLTDGSIVFYAQKANAITARTFDSNWVRTADRRVLAKGASNLAMVAAPGGGFLMGRGIENPDGTRSFKVTRFNAALDQDGPSARIRLSANEEAKLVALDTGNVLAVLSNVADNQIYGQMLKP